MPRVPNSKALQYVLDRKPFRGLNIYGRTLRHGQYCVFSYTDRWPLYLWYIDQWYGNDGWYSSSSTRHARLLCPADNVIRLPCSLLELFVLYLDTGAHHAGESLASVIRSVGFVPASERQILHVRSPAAGALPVTTHLANAVVDWGAVHRRKIMPV